MSDIQQTFDNADRYCWIDASGTLMAEFVSVEQADSYPLAEETWTLVAFDVEGHEL